MFEIVSILKKSELVKSINILDLIDEESIQLIKLKASLMNDSELFITEIKIKTKIKYSYHWQDKNGKLLLKWDNSPHYKNIATYPHHLHKGKNIKESYKISIEELLIEIKRYLFSDK